jgi:hypothetical protein
MNTSATIMSSEIEAATKQIEELKRIIIKKEIECKNAIEHSNDISNECGNIIQKMINSNNEELLLKKMKIEEEYKLEISQLISTRDYAIQESTKVLLDENEGLFMVEASELHSRLDQYIEVELNRRESG